MQLIYADKVWKAEDPDDVHCFGCYESWTSIYKQKDTKKGDTDTRGRGRSPKTKWI